MISFSSAVRRLGNSAVVWSWAFNGLRLASGLFLLPLLVQRLPKPEFGMYYVFLSILALIPLMDLGFSATIGRFISYAMAGAPALQAQGFVPSATTGATPNLPLLWQLLRTTRVLYRYVALSGFVVMGVWGTLQVGAMAAETLSPCLTWLAWFVTLLSAALELYSLWWNTFLYCINRVRESTQIGFLAYATRILLACVLLILGLGLLSLPLASIVGCLLIRFLSRRKCLAALGPPPTETGSHLSQASLIHLLWPNSWRLALQGLSVYLRTNANTQICAAVFGLAATAEYGLSVQVLNIAAGMATVWTSVKWPLVGQLRSAHNLAGLRRLLWPRVWLQIATFVFLSLGAIGLGPPALKLFDTDKVLLPTAMLCTMAVATLLDMTFVFWGTLLSVENRIPTLWSTVVTNVASFGLAYGLSRFTDLGVWSLILAPLLSGAVFIYWYWPAMGARSLGTTWLRFMFRPDSEARNSN